MALQGSIVRHGGRAALRESAAIASLQRYETLQSTRSADDNDSEAANDGTGPRAPRKREVCVDVAAVRAQPSRRRSDTIAVALQGSIMCTTTPTRSN